MVTVAPGCAAPGVGDVVAGLGSILGVWAHPDDETYLTGALMHCALRNGQRVACVNATAGEHGTSDPLVWPPRALGPMRRRELRASSSVLAEAGDGMVEHVWLDLPDGGCHDIRPEVGAAQVGSVIDRVRPDTVITFEPGGVTGHPDHRAVSEWTTIATRGRPGVRLLHAVVTESWTRTVGRSLDLGAYFADGHPEPANDESVVIQLDVDEQLWDIKDRALRAHATQTESLIESMGPDVWRAFNAVEAFVDATEPVAVDPA